MSHSYRAILRGDRLEWLGSSPGSDEPLPVNVVVQERAAIGGERSDLKLVTHNVRDYRWIAGLELLDPLGE